MNEELMRHRGEYVTLEMEFKKVTAEIASDVNSVYNWAGKMSKLEGDLDRYPSYFAKPIVQIENRIEQLKEIQKKHLIAKDLRERLERLRPLAMMDSGLS